MKIYQKNRMGMTLVEVILALALLSIVINVAYSILFVGQLSFDTSKNIGFAQQDARNPLDYVTNELKNSWRVYLEIPSQQNLDEDKTNLYYSLKLNNENKLELIEYDSTNVPASEKSRIIFSGAETLKFKPHIKENDGNVSQDMISLTITAIEGEGSKMYKKTYTTLIRFENSKDRDVIKYPVVDDNLVIPDEINIIYFTKR